MRKKISIFSFFSGIGLLDLAFEKNGYNIVFVNEYDELFLTSYQYARAQMNQHEPLYGYQELHFFLHKKHELKEPQNMKSSMIGSDYWRPLLAKMLIR